MQPIVLDTNIVLDLFVFADPATTVLHERLQAGALHWLATPPMRDELQRVLDYPQLQPRMAFHGLTVAQVLARFDGQVRWEAVAPKAPVTCKDPDDQKFIDLAVAHRALLLSKDAAVLTMRKRLAALQVGTAATLAAVPALSP